MSFFPNLIALDAGTAQKAVSLHLDDADTIQIGPRTFRKRILRFGRWAHPSAPGGVLDVNLSYAQKLAQNFNDKVWDHVTLPYGHPKSEQESAVNSAGEVIALAVESVGDPAVDGVWATCLFDAEHADKVGTKVKGCSAGIIPDYVDHEIGGKGTVGPVLAHLALTNEPYIKGLGEFSPVELSEDVYVLSLSKEDTTPMTLEEMLAALAKDHDIDVEALRTQVAAAEAVATENETLKAENETLKAQPPAEPQVKAEAKEEATKELVTALGNALSGSGLITLSESEAPSLQGVVSAVVHGLKAAQTAQVELAETRADNAVDAAIKDGRILAAKRDAFRSIYLSSGEEVFNGLLPDEPLIDLSEHGHDAGSEEPGGNTIDADAEADRIAADLAEI